MTLKELREKEKLTLTCVAKAIECPKQTYWNYERGIRKLPLEKAKLLAKLYNIPIESIEV